MAKQKTQTLSIVIKYPSNVDTEPKDWDWQSFVGGEYDGTAEIIVATKAREMHSLEDDDDDEETLTVS